MKKVIAEFEAHFEERKSNLGFNIQDGTAYIYLVADGMQMAEVAKLLLLKGKSKTFKVRICESEFKKDLNARQIKRSKVIR